MGGDFAANGCSNTQTGELYSCFMRQNILNSEMEESPFYSIPQAIWWVFTTITTGGYGDTYPTSFMGKVIAVITMHAGILGLALPISIIGTNFREIFDMRESQKFHQRMAKRLSGTHDKELMDEIKHSMESIVNHIDGLQTTIRLYEKAIHEKENVLIRRATKCAED